MKYTPSAFTGPMSGSSGALVASHNRSGAYFRYRAIPTNPNSIRQQAVRANFGTLVQYWTSTLSAAQRALWDDYASNTPVYDALGNPIYLTGQNQFIRSNTVRLQIGSSVIAAAPTTYNTGEPVTGFITTTDSTPNSLGVNMAGTTYDATATVAGGASDDGDVCLYIGSTLNPTRNFYKGPYQLVSATAIASAAFLANIATAFTAAANANGDPVDGQIRGVRARIMYDDGRLSQAYDAILPVVAASS